MIDINSLALINFTIFRDKINVDEVNMVKNKGFTIITSSTYLRKVNAIFVSLLVRF